MPTVKGDPRGTRAWRILRAQVLAASDRCYLCGRLGANTADHVIPVSERPDLALDPGNVAPAHSKCNSRKGGRRAPRADTIEPSRNW